jgi:membrane dipeptidase
MDISERSDYGQVDLVRLKEGGMDAQIFAVWPNPGIYMPDRMYSHSIYMIDLLEDILEKNENKISLARSPQDIIRINNNDKIAILIGVEGGTAIEDNLEKLENLYNRGVRYLGLTWNDSPSWATSAKDEVKGDINTPAGLTAFGIDVVKRMNRLGMIVDLSHSGEQTFYDVIRVSEDPVIASHSCVYSLCNHYRNLKDDQIRALAENGGVVFINFYPGYLDKDFDLKYSALRKASAQSLDSLKQIYKNPLEYRKHRNLFFRQKTTQFRPAITDLVNHMDYIVNLVGDDFVGLGSDFDGISILPKGIDDISDMPLITRELVNRGYSEESIRKILGGNFMRVFREVHSK